MDNREIMKFTIRSANTFGELDRVYRLTHDAYLEMGYCKPQPDSRLNHYPHLDDIPETTVLIAISEGRIIGTSSLTMDGEHRLPVDTDYNWHVDKVRAEGRKLASAWRIVTGVHGRKVVMGLLSCSVDLALQSDANTLLIVVNPHHEAVYKRLFNMEALASHKNSMEGLSHAPSVLLRVDRETIPAKWLR